MLPEEKLIELVSDPGRGRADKVLLALFAIGAPAPVSAIQRHLQDAGARDVESWNVSQILRRMTGTVALTNAGWKLLSAGRQRIQSAIPDVHGDMASSAAIVLREHAKGLPKGPLQEFVLEAVRCVEHRIWRAAIVLSWIGAVRHLQEIIIKSHLRSFNAALLSRFEKQRPVRSLEGFSRLQEADFLLVCEDIGFLSKSGKKMLEQRLDLRNAAGHPNSLHFDEAEVTAHVSFLINNVYKRR